MIKINKMTDYAVLIISKLSNAEDDFVSSDKLALICGLNKSTVSQILKTLSKGDFLGSKKGINGGVYLTRTIDKISLYDVLVLMEGGICLTECCDIDIRDCNCDCKHKCGLVYNWDKINNRIVDIFKKAKIKDLMEN